MSVVDGPPENKAATEGGPLRAVLTMELSNAKAARATATLAQNPPRPAAPPALGGDWDGRGVCADSAEDEVSQILGGGHGQLREDAAAHISALVQGFQREVLCVLTEHTRMLRAIEMKLTNHIKECTRQPSTPSLRNSLSFILNAAAASPSLAAASSLSGSGERKEEERAKKKGTDYRDTSWQCNDRSEVGEVSQMNVPTTDQVNAAPASVQPAATPSHTELTEVSPSQPPTADSDPPAGSGAVSKAKLFPASGGAVSLFGREVPPTAGVGPTHSLPTVPLLTATLAATQSTPNVAALLPPPHIAPEGVCR